MGHQATTRQGEDGPNGPEDGHKGHRSAEGPLAVSASVSEHGSPAQQAALMDLLTERHLEQALEAVAQTGFIETAATIVGIHPNTIHYRAKHDPVFKERLALARRRAGEKAAARSVQAVMQAPLDRLLDRPTLPIAVTNWLLPELRPNGAPIIDNRQLTVNVLSEQQAEAVARALAAVPPGEEMV